MAISHDPVTAAPTGIDIEAWTVEQAAEALQAANISTPTPPRPRANVTIDIPLDDDALVAANAMATALPRSKQEVHTVYKRSVPVRRDSLNRREAVLKGKEGSRRRQRWENDRLLSNPYAQPPLPSDWEVRPTYPIHSVPYFLAPLWDAEYKAKAQAKAQAKVTTRRANNVGDARAHGSKEEQAAARIPRELREKIKKGPGAKNMLKDLEEEVRSFVRQWSSKERQMAEDGLVDGDSEDEEIVFVGRNGSMSDDRKRSKSVVSDDSSTSISSEDLARERMILESLADDSNAAFGYVYASTLSSGNHLLTMIRRWLVHSIATYYGLETWSVTKGSPARREAYVGLKHKAAPAFEELPRPLYVLV
jgi:Arc/MetJ family transcription regulator